MAAEICKGIEFNRAIGRCEVWTRSEGIGATKSAVGYTCLRYLPTSSPTSPTTTSTTPTTTLTMPTTMLTTTTASTSILGRFTTEGCACRQSWSFHGIPCTDYCCNPDNDVGGEWCVVQDFSCQNGVFWGYCSSSGSSPVTTTTEVTTPLTPPDGPISQLLQLEWEHFGLVNELRMAGFTCPGGQAYPPNPVPLKFDCRLWKASQLHSKDMADQNYFSHTSLDGTSPWGRASAQGISANAENIAAGGSTAQATLDQWKGSDGHCKNMMNSGLTLFGVGYAYGAGSRYRHYWTQMLSSSSVAVDNSCYLSQPLQLLRRGAQESMGSRQSVVVGDPWNAPRQLPRAP